MWPHCHDTVEMQHPLTKLTITESLLCVSFFVWSSLRLLGRNDWQIPRWQATGLPPDEASRLVLQAYNLEMQLEAAKSEAVALNRSLALHDAPAVPSAERSPYAYVFYATSDPYACSVLVNIHRLQRLFITTIPIHVLVTPDVSTPYLFAFRASNITLHIQQPPPLSGGLHGGYYGDCLLKLLAFKLHVLSPGLERVLAFDANQLILRNLNALFTGLPPVGLAAPRAYWLAKDYLASTFLMITLSDRLWKTVETALGELESNEFDMDLVNKVLGNDVMMLSGEYVTLNSHWEDWNLPGWFHGGQEVNWTTVKMINDIAAGRFGAQSVAKKGNKRRNGPILLDTDTPAVQGALVPEKPFTTESTHTPPSMRFPSQHPLNLALYDLLNATAVIHFTAVGKPWSQNAEMLRLMKPDAHPVLSQLVEIWCTTAQDVCHGSVAWGEKLHNDE